MYISNNLSQKQKYQVFKKNDKLTRSKQRHVKDSVVKELSFAETEDDHDFEFYIQCKEENELLRKELKYTQEVLKFLKEHPEWYYCCSYCSSVPIERPRGVIGDIC